LNKHDYEKEIIEIISSEGGTVIGFNNFMKKGSGKGFHSKYLKKYLNKLEKERKISIKNEGNRQVFTLIEFDFDKKFSKYRKDIEKIHTWTFRPNQSHKKQLHLVRMFLLRGFEKNNQLITAWLYANCEGDMTRASSLEKARKMLLDSMKNILLRLDEIDRQNLINSLPYV